MLHFARSNSGYKLKLTGDLMSTRGKIEPHMPARWAARYPTKACGRRLIDPALTDAIWALRIVMSHHVHPLFVNFAASVAFQQDIGASWTTDGVKAFGFGTVSKGLID
jgi:hypothetical protein